MAEEHVVALDARALRNPRELRDDLALARLRDVALKAGRVRAEAPAPKLPAARPELGVDTLEVPVECGEQQLLVIAHEGADGDVDELVHVACSRSLVGASPRGEK